MEVKAAAFASRAYARRLPPRYGLGDVDWIAWAPPFEEMPPNPQLRAVLGERFRPVFTSNDYLVQLAAAEAGVGVMVLGRRFHRLSRIGQFVELDLISAPARAPPSTWWSPNGWSTFPGIRAVTDALLGELDSPSLAGSLRTGA